MSDEFAKGDVVWLKSGGPAMTVTNPKGRGQYGAVVFCDWLTDDGQAHDKGFPPESLTKTNPHRPSGGVSVPIKGL